MKILILKPSSLGDVVQALPVLRVIKRHQPASAVYWWIDSRWSELLEGDPDLAGIFRFHRRRWADSNAWIQAAASLRELRGLRFDWVIDLQALIRSGLVAWLAGARRTIGLDDMREGAPAFYDLAVRRPTPLTHAVDWYLEVPRRLGIPSDPPFDWIPQRREVAARVRRKFQLDQNPLVLLQPGARWENKRWPRAAYRALVEALAQAEPDLRFGVLGSADEHALAAEIVAAVPERVLDCTGATSVVEMVELIRCAAVVIANDSGPMHVAAALGKPVVAIFGPTEPRRTGPYGQVQRVLQARDLSCVPCMRSICRNPVPLECLQRVTVDQVAGEVLRRIERAN